MGNWISAFTQAETQSMVGTIGLLLLGWMIWDSGKNAKNDSNPIDGFVTNFLTRVFQLWALLVFGLLLGVIYQAPTLQEKLGMGSLVSICMLVAFAWTSYKKRQDIRRAAVAYEVSRWQRQEGPYGKAGWAKHNEVKAFGLFERSRRALLLGRYIENYGPMDEPSPVTAEALEFSGETNIITIGPAGSGKGATAIIPVLLTSDENMFVLDIKGENWAVTHRYREQGLGHRVITIDPFNVSKLGNKRARYNPLEALIVKNGQTRPGFAMEINDIGEALIVTEGKDPHWCNRARDLVTCLIAHVCSTPGETPTLPRVREILGLSDEKFVLYMTRAAENPIPLVRDNAAKFISVESTDVRGIISTAIGQLNFLVEPEINWMLENSTFKLSDLRREKMTIYFIIPPKQLKTYYRFVRLFVQSLIGSLSTPPTPGQAPVLMILDEQAQLGYMQTLEESAALLRGYKVRMWSIFQNMAQLKRLYKDGWETFMSNAGIQQFFTSNDRTTAEYISQKIGNCSVSITSTSNSSSFNRGTSSQSGHGNNGGSSGSTSGSGTSFSSSTALHGIPFMSMQELYGLNKEIAVVMVAGLEFPVRQFKEDYRANPNLTGRWDANPFHDGGSAHDDEEAAENEFPQQRYRERPTGWGKEWDTASAGNPPHEPPELWSAPRSESAWTDGTCPQCRQPVRFQSWVTTIQCHRQQCRHEFPNEPPGRKLLPHQSAEATGALIVTTCPSCERRVRLRQGRAGQQVQCPREDCRKSFVLSGQEG